MTIFKFLRTCLSLCFVFATFSAIGADGAVATQTLSFKYSKGIPEAQIRILQRDLKRLDHLVLSDPDGELKRIYKIPDTHPETLKAWLAERTQFIVDQAHPIDTRSVFAIDQTIVYPPAATGAVSGPEATKDSEGLFNAGPARVIMRNLGASLYLAGKSQKAFVGFRVDGGDLIEIRSPRAGILMLGQAFFDTQIVNAPQKEIHNRIHSFFRLYTLFHESRHGDGHAESLSFSHAKCPVDHDYAGHLACDTPSNGPYRVGALFLKAAVKGCRDCAAGEKEMLQLFQADNESRILEKEEWKDEPEFIIDAPHSTELSNEEI